MAEDGDFDQKFAEYIGVKMGRAQQNAQKGSAKFLIPLSQKELTNFRQRSILELLKKYHRLVII